MLIKALTTLFMAGVAVAQTGNIVQVLTSNTQTSQLASLLGSYPSLVSALQSNSSFTIFAPSDTAFSTANTTGITNFTNILEYHVVSGAAIYSSNLTMGAQFVNTILTNTSVDYFADDRGLPLEVVKMDSGVTLFFGLGNASVTTADIQASNGVIHIIDNILTPPLTPSETAIKANLTGLVSSMKTANLVSTIDSKKSITIFAPINTAFDTVPTNISVSQLTSILEYHIISGVYYSTNITSLKAPANVATLNGATLKVEFANGTLLVNGNMVLIADILIDSGVVHVIDAILSPPSSSSSSSPTNTSTAGTSMPSSDGSFQKASTVIALIACFFSFLLL